MQTEAIVQQREPVSGVEIDNPEADTVYLLPTAHDGDGKLAYMGADALLLKQAVANGIPVEYAVAEEDREFVEHFSAGIEIVTLTVAILGLIPSTIQGIYALIQLVAMRKGIKEDDLRTAEIRLRIDYIKTPVAEARGVEISGDPDGVVAIMERLSKES